MDQRRLFRLAVEAIALTAWRSPSGTWVLTIRCRRGDEGWAEAGYGGYELLDSSELLDVIDAHLGAALGL